MIKEPETAWGFLLFNKSLISHHPNVHLQATEKPKLKWFDYLEEYVSWSLQYVGSTNLMTHRLANTKEKCNDRNASGTGLETHLKAGCPYDTGAEKSHMKITLLEHMAITHDELKEHKHRDSPGCRCNLCGK